MTFEERISKLEPTFEDRVKKVSEKSEKTFEDRIKNLKDKDSFLSSVAKGTVSGIKKAVPLPVKGAIDIGTQLWKSNLTPPKGVPEVVRDEQGYKIANPEGGVTSSLLDDPIVDLTMSAGTAGLYNLGKAGVKAGLKAAGREAISSVTMGVSDVAGSMSKKAAKYWKSPAGQKRLKESAEFLHNSVTKMYKNKAEVLGGVWNGIKETKATPLIEKLQYDWKIVKNWEETPGLELTKTLTPSETRQLMFGRIKHASEEAAKEIKLIDKDLLNASKELKIKDPDLKKQVYDYLVTKHAPYYNKQHGEKAAKFTTEEAAKRMEEIKNLPHSKKIEELAGKIKSFNDDTLSLMHSRGASYALIDEDEMKFLKNTYPEHVPLYRIQEGEDIIEAVSGRGLGVSGSGLKRAKGSELDIEDILQNVYVARERVIQRLEKNIVDNATYDAVLDTMRSFPEQDLFEIVSAKAKGKAFDDTIITNKNDLIRDPSILPLRRYGKDDYIKIKDPHMAVALRGVSREKINGFVKAMSVIPHYYASLATRYNIDFMLSNKLRDLPEALVTMAASNKSTKKSVLKAITTDTKSIWDIRNWTKGKMTDGAKAYQEMRSLGGFTGGGHYGTTQQVIKDFKKIIKENRNTPTALFSKVIEPINKLNQYFEDSTKLTVFKRLKELNVPPAKAASIAKEAGLDFDKMGTWGSTINSIWMFSNASVQGSVRTIKALSKNPKVLLGTVTAIGTSVWGVGEFNDNIDPDWRNKVSDWDKLNGLNVMLNDEGYYISIPSPYSLKPIKVLWDKLYDLSHKENIDVAEASSDIMSSIVEGYAPLSGSDIGQALTPTAIRLPADLRANKSYTGFKIARDEDKYAPESIKYYPGLGKSIQGRSLIKWTKKLSEATGKRIEINPAQVNYVLENIKGGAGRIPFKAVEAVKAIAKPDEEHPVLNVLSKAPITGRFVRHTEPEYYRDKEEEKVIKKDMGEISRKRFYQDKDLKEIMKNDYPDMIEFISQYEPEDQERLVKKFVEAKLKKGVPDKAWYQKLVNLPPEVREKIFEMRYNKVSNDVKSQMKKAAARMPGFLTEGFFTKRAIRKYKKD